MCLAIPAKVLKIRGKDALVDFGGVRRDVRIDMVDVQVGDYVIVHTGYAIQTMSEEDARESLKMFEEILSAE
jgi:hydrogenase expression/formation protein HypC